MKLVPHGEPYAGKLHVRFDEGADVPHGASRSTLHPYSPLSERLLVDGCTPTRSPRSRISPHTAALPLAGARGERPDRGLIENEWRPSGFAPKAHSVSLKGPVSFLGSPCELGGKEA